MLSWALENVKTWAGKPSIIDRASIRRASNPQTSRIPNKFCRTLHIRFAQKQLILSLWNQIVQQLFCRLIDVLVEFYSVGIPLCPFPRRAPR